MTDDGTRMSARTDTISPAIPALCSTRALAYAPAMAHQADDGALMLRYRDGDVGAFETLYRRHNDAIYRYLLRLSGHRDTADDVFQDVWGKIINARATSSQAKGKR